ncbi:MAG TPA: c-type cytochrome [Myxococcales bacterium]|nr:c-type cytochrome [Myxococcales bacterium]
MGKPVERQNLSVTFFVLAALIALSTLWCFKQEFFDRRPWMAYQDTFFKKYLIPKSQHDLDVAEAEFKKHDKDLQTLEAQLAEAEAAVKDPAKRGPFEKAEEDLDRLNIKVAEAEQDVKFAKSDLDAAYYKYKHAEHGGLTAEIPETQGAMRDVEARIDRLNKQLASVTLDRDAAQGRFDHFAGRITELQKQIEELRTPVDDAQRKLDKAKDKGTEMTQYWIPDLATANPPGVDRCQNCHAAIDTCGFSDPHEIVADRRAQKEALDAAGGADDAALAKLDQDLAKKYCVDVGRVQTWAAELDKDPKRTTFTGYDLPLVFRTHPYRNELIGANHPAETFGCTICHGGEGPQTKGIGFHKFEHAYDDHYWAGWNEPLLDLAQVNGKTLPGHPFVQAMCAQCHRDDTNLKFAPVLDNGRKFMAEIGCYGCHPIDGYEKMRHPGPTLTDVQAKLTPAWMENWISYPRAWRPHTRMPNFWPEAIDEATGKVKEGSPAAKLRQDEVTAITAYLWTHSTKNELPAAPALATASADRGRDLVSSVGCYACHKIEQNDARRPIATSESRDFAPDLWNIGAKTNKLWIYWWLKNPTAMWPETKMPNLRLSDQDAADIATYLAQHTGGQDFSKVPPEFQKGYDPRAFADLVTQGRSLIDKYGCFGCHSINGFENAQKIGANLSDFGKKAVDLLDFGDAITDHHQQNWYNWLNLKLRHPRAYRYERVDTRMPQFDFSDDEVKMLMVFLKSQKGPAAVPHKYLAAQDPEKAAIITGDHLVDFYNCRGCHMIDGQGGVIRDRYKDDPGKADDLSMAPPKLNGEGAKLQPAWGFEFVKHPIPLRPWLHVRMPTFPLTDEQATDIIHWFAAKAGQSWPYAYVSTPMPPAAEIDQAKKLMDTLQCLHCHVLGTPGPDVDLATAAPNLYMAEQRLRPDWIVSWITNPSKIVDDTKMPSFFAGGASPAPQFFGGDAKRQIEALRDLLMHLHEALPPPASPTQSASTKPAKHGRARHGRG